MNSCISFLKVGEISKILNYPFFGTAKNIVKVCEKFSTYKSYDYMTIYDGSQNKNSILATLSGEFSHDLHSNGSRLVLHFETSKKNEKFIGFQIQYDGTINISFPTIFNKISLYLCYIFISKY